MNLFSRGWRWRTCGDKGVTYAAAARPEADGPTISAPDVTVTTQSGRLSPASSSQCTDHRQSVPAAGRLYSVTLIFRGEVGIPVMARLTVAMTISHSVSQWHTKTNSRGPVLSKKICKIEKNFRRQKIQFSIPFSIVIQSALFLLIFLAFITFAGCARWSLDR